MKYVFDLERSARGLRLNRFLHGLTQAANRKLLLEMQLYELIVFC